MLRPVQTCTPELVYRNCLHARHAARLVVCGCLVLVLGARDVGRDAGRAVARMTRTPALSAAREREDAQGARVAVDERG